MSDTLFYHEDDYCMIELTPRENVQALKEESDTISVLADKNFHGGGYKDMHVIKENRVKLHVRKISPADLETIIDKTGFKKAFVVTSGYGQTYREKKRNTFGFGKGYAAIYYSVRDNVVDRIWFKKIRSLDKQKTVSCLSEIGEKWDLLLMDWFKTRMVDLSDNMDIETYLGRNT